MTIILPGRFLSRTQQVRQRSTNFCHTRSEVRQRHLAHVKRTEELFSVLVSRHHIQDSEQQLKQHSSTLTP